MFKWVPRHNLTLLIFQFPDPVSNVEGIMVDMVNFCCAIKKELFKFARRERRSVLNLEIPTATILWKTGTPPTNINLSPRHVTEPGGRKILGTMYSPAPSVKFHPKPSRSSHPFAVVWNHQLDICLEKRDYLISRVRYGFGYSRVVKEVKASALLWGVTIFLQGKRVWLIEF